MYHTVRTVVDYRGKAWKVRKNRNIEEWRRRRIEGEDIQTNIGTKRSVFIVQEFVFNYTTACEIDVYIYRQVCIMLCLNNLQNEVENQFHK